jgi:hypothetical protein
MAGTSPAMTEMMHSHIPGSTENARRIPIKLAGYVDDASDVASTH